MLTHDEVDDRPRASSSSTGRATATSWSTTVGLHDFAAALAFVNAVGAAAEAANHHPDIDIRWNKVRLALTTHDAGGLTLLDLALAAADRPAPSRRPGPGLGCRRRHG